MNMQQSYKKNNEIHKPFYSFSSICRQFVRLFVESKGKRNHNSLVTRRHVHIFILSPLALRYFYC